MNIMSIMHVAVHPTSVVIMLIISVRKKGFMP